MGAAPLLLALWTGCERVAPPPTTYVARVGDRYLLPEEMSEALAVLPAGADSALASQQFADQWVTSELLAQEAVRDGLREREDVRKLIAENERAVLAAALLDAFYEQTSDPPPGEVQAYFEANQDRLKLREPYLRVRLISTADADSADAARSLLQDGMMTGRPDSAFARAVNRYALDPEASLTLAGNFFPRSRITQSDPALTQRIEQMGPGQISPVIPVLDRFVVVQLVDRQPAGSVPPLEWVADEVRQMVRIERRRQLLAQKVQQLKSEAIARGELLLPAAAAPAAPAPRPSAAPDSLSQ
jgi:parvulin-like peptidyl-prolyl isomerase